MPIINEANSKGSNITVREALLVNKLNVDDKLRLKMIKLAVKMVENAIKIRR
ncbi:hypothetical protein [Mesobacillus persicus]|uniref:hypothetical protein n=1 Tax=Mesobacillus persicus TaxID=930146 RepID=UPI001FCD0571|nr:hypothetical protein [Mesobacillus persicus]